ncbi:hypothetical protein KKH3_05400 [Pectobacterium actinidiae]|nr:hypothetical protein KKH3_05400 [Pectobacterium actinidiae]
MRGLFSDICLRPVEQLKQRQFFINEELTTFFINHDDIKN